MLMIHLEPLCTTFENEADVCYTIPATATPPTSQATIPDLVIRPGIISEQVLVGSLVAAIVGTSIMTTLAVWYVFWRKYSIQKRRSTGLVPLAPARAPSIDGAARPDRPSSNG